MNRKGKDVAFMDNDAWLNDLAFLVDITRHLSDLNLKLQGKDQLVHKLFGHVQAFTQKLTLFKGHISQKKFVHFPTLGTRPDASVDHLKYGEMITRLGAEFDRRFQDFRGHVAEMRIFADPFTCDVNAAPDDYQLEIIEVQNDEDLKREFTDLHGDIATFYGRYVSSATHPNLHTCALRFLSLFGSTYCCEQLFSRMKDVKTKARSLLSDEHLTGILRIGTTNVDADINSLCKQKQCQISH